MAFWDNGIDAEFAIRNKEGAVVSALDVIDRNISHRLFGNGRHCSTGKFYPDGIMAEFGVDPHTCHGYFIDRVMSAIISARKNGWNPKLVSFVPANEVVTTDNPQAYISGCKPKLNAYTMNSGGIHNYRDIVMNEGVFFGTHLHHSTYPRLHQSQAAETVRRFVKLSLVPITLMINTDEWWKRLELTGIGQCRIKSYGLEWCDLGSTALSNPMYLMVALHHNRLILSAYATNNGYFDSGYTDKGIVSQAKDWATAFIKSIDESCDDREVFSMFAERDILGLRQYWDVVSKSLEIEQDGGWREHGHGNAYQEGCNVLEMLTHLIDTKGWCRDVYGIDERHFRESFGYESFMNECCRLTGMNTPSHWKWETNRRKKHKEAKCIR